MPLPAALAKAPLGLFATLAMGGAGGFLLNQCGMSLAWLLGSLVATALASRFISFVRVPKPVRDWTIPIIGVLVGSSFTPDLLAAMPGWWPGILIAALYVSALTVLGTLYFRLVAKFDLATALFSALPAGLTEVTLMGAMAGGRLGVLALVHTVRILAVVVLVPLILPFVMEGVVVSRSSGLHASPVTVFDLGLVAVIAVAGSLIAGALRIPAAQVLGPMALSAVLHLSGFTTVVPPGWLIVLAQITLGSYIGARLHDMAARDMRDALLHGLVFAIGLVVLTVMAALVLAPLLGNSVPAMILALCPGGLAEMALMTLAVGIDVAFVTCCHLMRILVVYAVAPIAMKRMSAPEPPDIG